MIGYRFHTGRGKLRTPDTTDPYPVALGERQSVRTESFEMFSSGTDLVWNRMWRSSRLRVL